MWPKSFFSPSYWAQVFWGPVVAESASVFCAPQVMLCNQTNKLIICKNDELQTLRGPQNGI